MKIVCFGDSNTYGFCGDPLANGGKTRFPGELCWPSLLHETFGSGHVVLERGACGRTALQAEADLQADLASVGELGALVLWLGTNDTQERLALSPAEITLGVERLLIVAKEQGAWCGDARLLLVAPPVIGTGYVASGFGTLFGAGCVEKSQALSSLYQDLAQRFGCSFLDLQQAECNASDCIHLTLAGHKQVADLMGQALRPLLG